jgi:hypothetical protein
MPHPERLGTLVPLLDVALDLTAVRHVLVDGIRVIARPQQLVVVAIDGMGVPSHYTPDLVFGDQFIG